MEINIDILTACFAINNYDLGDAALLSHLFQISWFFLSLNLHFSLFGIGANDLLHQRMADHVNICKVGKTYSPNTFKNTISFNEAGLFPFRQINLGDIAGDDCFGIKTQPGKEHFHLFMGGILSFIKNNKGVILPLSSNDWVITGDKTNENINYVYAS